MAPPRIRKVFSGFAPDLQIDLKGPCNIFGVNVGEPWAPGEVEEEVLKRNGKGFITSPADIDLREPIQLRDAEVTPEHRKAFEDLCSEFETIFSKDSADLGKTPLLKMDIPTGDNPPITQRPYTLALKHVQWVQEEIEILEKVGIIAKSVSPWASPIVIVPKKTAPGNPLEDECVLIIAC